MNQANEVCNLEMQSFGIHLHLITHILVVYVANEGNRDDMEMQVDFFCYKLNLWKTEESLKFSFQGNNNKK